MFTLKQFITENKQLNLLDDFVSNNQILFKKIVINDSKTFSSFFDLENLKIEEMNSSFQHMQYLKKHFSKVRKKLDDFENNIEDEKSRFLDDVGDDHPGFHSYENSIQDTRMSLHAEIFKDIAKTDRIYRVGIFKKLVEVGPVYMNGKSPNIVKKDETFFREFSSLLDKKLVWAKD
jgi:hypothetical protein